MVHEHRRGEVAQRWGSILVGLAVVFIAGWMTVEGMDPRPIKKDTTDAAVATADASSTLMAAATDGGATGATVAPATDDLDAGLYLSSPSFGDAGLMPATAPRQVKIGVVLVTFAGAEGAPATARSKRDAQGIADRLGQDARTDFHQAVKAGDPGSSDDIGRLPRGVLDPRTEVAVFALAKDEVSEVLETPKGYWIVKRIE